MRVDNELIWSKSRFNSFQECLRKHAFSTWAPDVLADPAQQSLFDQVARLKRLKNRFLWGGTVVHESIGRLLMLLRQGRDLPSLEEILLATKEKMREQFRVSRDHGEGRLFEHEYGPAILPQRWQERWISVEGALRRFFVSPWVDRFRLLPPESWKAVDEVLSFELEGIKAYVKVDCATEQAGRFRLFDWKNSDLRAEDEFSMNVAALYAIDVWGAHWGSIEGWVISLKRGEEKRISINEETLRRTKERILNQANQLEGHQPSCRGGPLEVPKTANERICERCNFKKICYPAARGARAYAI